MERVVVVLGGNAFVQPGQRLSIEGQLKFAYQALTSLLPLLGDDTQLLLSHGNGPQVGQILTRVEAAVGKAYPLPLEVCVAESEGELGYVLQRGLYNVLADQGRLRSSVVLLSHVEVDPLDPAFAHPTKPIGVFYDAQQAASLRQQGWTVVEDSGRGWRRTVPSPVPRAVLELDVIRRLLEQQVIVIAGGGGGIPVVRTAGQVRGVEAVVDKDATGALLARELAADRFLILTDVPCVYRDFRGPQQRSLEQVTAAEIRQLAADGEFAPGSMLPKVEAAAAFAAATGREAIICNPTNLPAALRGEGGTRVVAASPSPPAVITVPATSAPHRCLILGAAGRDFHNYLTFFRHRPEFQVCGFTAAQIPFIERREFPASLAGPRIGHALPIFSEERLPELIRELSIDFVFLAYSDLSHEEVMHKASIAQAAGASFALLGPRHTQLASRRPVISVTAVRTGAGKSPLSQFLATQLTARGHRVGVLRHPMPYGDLAAQRVERLAHWEDLDRFDCTIEEREEYEPYLERGLTIFAGVDYAQVLAAAEGEADLILWDGGNNDFSFIQPRLSLVVVDALRPGHESRYHPGEVNVRSADILVINKVGGADPLTVARLQADLAALNPRATQIAADLALDLEPAESLAGRSVLVVEDGPTLTHGGMAYGAGTVAAGRWGATTIVDPRPGAVGSLAEAYRQFPHLGKVLPALGYSPQQRSELEETIRNCPSDVIVDASPCRLERLLRLDRPLVRVRYRFQQVAGPDLLELVQRVL